MKKIRTKIKEMFWRCEQLVKFDDKLIKSNLWWYIDVCSQIEGVGMPRLCLIAYGAMTFRTPWWVIHMLSQMPRDRSHDRSYDESHNGSRDRDRSQPPTTCI